MRILLIILLCAACQSKTLRSPQNKATLEPTPEQSVEIEAVIEYSPRQAQDLDNAILLNHQIQACLRLAYDIRETHFSVGMEGFIRQSGSVEKLNIRSQDQSLKACLQNVLSRLNLGSGGQGPFKMHVNRAQNTGKKGKSLILDLSEGPNSIKKWQ